MRGAKESEWIHTIFQTHIKKIKKNNNYNYDK